MQVLGDQTVEEDRKQGPEDECADDNSGAGRNRLQEWQEGYGWHLGGRDVTANVTTRLVYTVYACTTLMSSTPVFC